MLVLNREDNTTAEEPAVYVRFVVSWSPQTKHVTTYLPCSHFNKYVQLVLQSATSAPSKSTSCLPLDFIFHRGTTAVCSPCHVCCLSAGRLMFSWMKGKKHTTESHRVDGVRVCAVDSRLLTLTRVVSTYCFAHFS